MTEDEKGLLLIETRKILNDLGRLRDKIQNSSELRYSYGLELLDSVIWKMKTFDTALEHFD